MVTITRWHPLPAEIPASVGFLKTRERILDPKLSVAFPGSGHPLPRNAAERDLSICVGRARVVQARSDPRKRHESLPMFRVVEVKTATRMSLYKGRR